MTTIKESLAPQIEYDEERYLTLLKKFMSNLKFFYRKRNDLERAIVGFIHAFPTRFTPAFFYHDFQDGNK